jgi:SET domain-containing protein
MKSHKLIIELKPSQIDIGGVGVFAVVNIRKGEKVADGLTLDDFKKKNLIKWKNSKHFDKATMKKIMDFCVGTCDGFVPPNNLDFNSLSADWYFNHSCDGNVGFDKNGDFIAIKNIKAGDELSYDYGLVESNPNLRMLCKCNSVNCRKIITGEDWKVLIHDKTKCKYIHPFITILAKKEITK